MLIEVLLREGYETAIVATTVNGVEQAVVTDRTVKAICDEIGYQLRIEGVPFESFDFTLQEVS